MALLKILRYWKDSVLEGGKIFFELSVELKEFLDKSQDSLNIDIPLKINT